MISTIIVIIIIPRSFEGSVWECEHKRKKWRLVIGEEKARNTEGGIRRVTAPFAFICQLSSC